MLPSSAGGRVTTGGIVGFPDAAAEADGTDVFAAGAVGTGVADGAAVFMSTTFFFAFTFTVHLRVTVFFPFTLHVTVAFPFFFPVTLQPYLPLFLTAAVFLLLLFHVSLAPFAFVTFNVLLEPTVNSNFFLESLGFTVFAPASPAPAKSVTHIAAASIPAISLLISASISFLL